MKTTMLNSKFQPSSTREIPISNQQTGHLATASVRRPAFRSLKLGASLEVVHPPQCPSPALLLLRTGRSFAGMPRRTRCYGGRGAWCLVLFLTTNVLAQNYSIDWFTVDGGGGTSTGGAFSVNGTVGQPDAGHLSGGNYAIDDGFWGIIASVQTPGMPPLTITRTSTNTVAVSWPSPSTGFVLQQNGNLSTTSWVNASQIPADDGTTKSVLINPPTGNLYFRLKK